LHPKSFEGVVIRANQSRSRPEKWVLDLRMMLLWMRTNYKFKKREAKGLGVAFQEIGREGIGELKSEIW